MATNKDVKGGISYIQQLIREKRFFIFNNCLELIDEVSMYHYPEPDEGKESKDLPEKFNDHLCDAVRYAIYSFRPMVLTPTDYSQKKHNLRYYPSLGV